jgi:hypothetical protein
MYVLPLVSVTVPTAPVPSITDRNIREFAGMAVLTSMDGFFKYDPNPPTVARVAQPLAEPDKVTGDPLALDTVSPDYSSGRLNRIADAA